jgi:hypothetical protein
MPIFYCCLLYLVAMLATLRAMAVFGFAPPHEDAGDCLAFVILGAMWPVLVPGAILLGAAIMIFDGFGSRCLSWLVGFLSQDEGDRT